MPGVAYDPYNPAQNAFLGALSLSEIGNAKNGLNLGTGYVDLSSAPRDEYGFPEWSGTGNSHAAGLFQFQPGTWESYAKTYDLDFQDANDQKAAAWYLAQDTYRKEKGGDLLSALEAGEYSSIESALGRTQWIGARGKLAEFLAGGKSAQLPDGNATPEDTSKRAQLDQFFADRRAALAGGGIGALIGDTASRVLVFVAGAIILFVAAWWLLSSSGVVPSAGSVAKRAVKAATVAA